MAFFDELGKKARDVAATTVDLARDTASLLKINMAIASEQREVMKNYRIIGEWFVTEYSGEIPEAVQGLVDSVSASKAKIAELEASKPSTAKDASPADSTAASPKVCPICGSISDSKFCPECGAPMESPAE